MRLAWIVCSTTIIASLFLPIDSVSAGDRYLDALRREVDEPAAPESSGGLEGVEPRTPRSGGNGWSSDSADERSPGRFTFSPFGGTTHDERDSTEQAMSWVLLLGVTSPWWLPYAILESDPTDYVAFPAGPYANGHEGYLVLDPETIQTKSWGGRISLDSADNLDGVTTLTGRVRFDTDFRVGLDAEWASLIERSPGGADWLGRGDCNLVVRFAQSARAQFHSGIGINWLADRNSADVGFNVTYGVDLFPVDRVVTSATLDWGKIGDSSLIHFRGTLGLMVRPRLHLYTGYDLLNLEGNSIHSLLTGLELWF